MSSQEAIAQGAEQTAGIPYSPELAWDFFEIDGKHVNDTVFNYLEMFWGFYFAIYFGVLGSNLDRVASFVYSLRVFGFYSVWLLMRANPVFMDPLIFEQLSRCVLAAGMGALCAQIFKTQKVLECYTVVSLGTVYIVDFFDPLLREKAGCMDTLGEPNRWYPKGSWLSCKDWQFAYAVQWTYVGLAYVIVAIILCVYKCCFSNNKTITRWAQFFAVAMTSASAAVLSLKGLVRVVPDSWEAHMDDFMNLVFWGLVGFIFLVQECLYCCVASCLADCCLFQVFLCFAAPMYWVENTIEWIECIVLNKKKDEEDAEDLEEPLTPGGSVNPRVMSADKLGMNVL